MIKKFLGIFLVSLAVLSIFSPRVLAQQTEQEFSSTYNVVYDVDVSGVTVVTEDVAIKNLTDRYYASSFSLIIGATNISDVKASDSGGGLDTSVDKEGTKTKITISFPSQIAGKDKTYKFTLKFNSKDFAQQQGKIWQVSVPKIASSSNVDSYSLDLKVPLEFGDPTSILPEPKSQAEAGGKIDLNYSKDQLLESGILASFGSDQLLGFNLTYHLNNNSFLPKLTKVPLPPDTNFQKVSIDNINPKPDNVTIDPDGNYVGWFKVDRYSGLDVNISGLAKLYINSQDKLPFLLSATEQQIYTGTQKYWEKDNPLITAELGNIFKSGVPQSNKDKARLINNFVVSTLAFSSDRLGKGDFSRLGGLTGHNYPNDALAAEFTDYFVTLARAENIPARQLIGYAYSSNTDLRPLSYGGTNLHTWPEYYDPQYGWVMIDPTWQNTTGGVDYFSKFDLDHFILAINGYDSDSFPNAAAVKVNFSDAQFNPHSDLSILMSAPGDIYSGFPSTLKVDIVNNGSAPFDPAVLSLTSSKIQIAGNSQFNTPKIPPFGRLEYNFPLRTISLLASFDETLRLSIADKSVEQKIIVRPFFANKLLPAVVIGVIIAMVAIYLTVLILYVWKYRKKGEDK